MRDEEFYISAGQSFAHKLEVCKANKWIRSIETLEMVIDKRIEDLKNNPEMLEAFKKGLEKTK